MKKEKMKKEKMKKEKKPYLTIGKLRKRFPSLAKEVEDRTTVFYKNIDKIKVVEAFIFQDQPEGHDFWYAISKGRFEAARRILPQKMR